MGLEARLYALSKEKKTAQQEQAEIADIHPNVLGRHEKGEASASVEIASKVSNVLCVSLDSLFGNTDAELDKSLMDTIVSIQKPAHEDKTCIFYYYGIETTHQNKIGLRH